MQIPFCGFDVKMTKQILNVFDVGSLVKQMGGKTMPQTVYPHFFPDQGFAFGVGKYLLHSPGRIGCTGLFRFKEVKARTGPFVLNIL